MKSCLIIGGGVAGCAAAHQLSLLGGWNITLIEQAPFLGAGVRTFFFGGHPFTMGPRHLLTQNEKVYHYLNELLPLRSCAGHQFWTYVAEDSQFYNFPIHVDDIERMPEKDRINEQLKSRGAPLGWQPKNFEEYWQISVGDILYRKFIDRYSQKMWGVPGKKIDTFNWSPKGVALKSGPRAAWDTAISAYPYAKDGYNGWFDKATAGVKVLLSTQIRFGGYSLEKKSVRINGDWHKFDIIVSTISPDIPFNYCFGRLPYIGRDFHKMVLPVEFALPPEVFFIYEAGSEKWTRIVEYKKLTNHKSSHTLIGMEIPSSNGKHYPLPIKKYQQQAERYFKLMPPGVYSLGRSGSYRYGLDIAGCIEQATELAEVVKVGGQSHPVIGEKWRKI